MAKAKLAKRKRRSKLELQPDVRTKILSVLSVGASRQTAYQLANLSPQTFHNWMRRGQEGEEPFKSFAEAVTAAELNVKTDYLSIIQHAARSGDWKAASWFLERRFPKDYGHLVKVEADVTVRPALDLSKLDDDELSQLRALAAKAS